MFTHSAQYYDAIYLGQGKDYKAEADKVEALILAAQQDDGQVPAGCCLRDRAAPAVPAG